MPATQCATLRLLASWAAWGSSATQSLAMSDTGERRQARTSLLARRRLSSWLERAIAAGQSTRQSQTFFLSFPSEGARAAAPRQQQRQARQALRQVEQGPSTQPARSTRTHARAHARAHARPAGAAAVPEVRGATRHAREGMQERGGVGTQEGGGETCTGHTAWGAIHAKGRPGGGRRHLRSARTCLCAASSKRPVKTFCPA